MITVFKSVTGLAIAFSAVLPMRCQSTAKAALPTLDSTIPHVALTTGAETIGGASIEDAVVLLRSLTVFPICIELKDFSREADGLTLGEALTSLENLKSRQELGIADVARLKRYEELAASEPTTTLIGFRKNTFTLVQDNVTVRALLDRLVILDNTYVWHNDGTSEAPVVVIAPAEKSVLDWPVPAICGPTEELSTARQYGPSGKLTRLFGGHEISRLEINEGNAIPYALLPLCREGLNARDVLNLTIEAVGHDLSWSLSGTKGARWLTFQ